MKSNPNYDSTLTVYVAISCVLYISATFFTLLTIKVLLKMYQEKITFTKRLDDIKYHLSLMSMEIVEITEQYCYTMNIGISIIVYE